MSFVPFLNRIKVLPDLAETQTKSGIIIPGQEDKRQYTGTVIAVGDSVDILTPGMKVMFGMHAGFKRNENASGEELPGVKDAVVYQYMNEEDVVAIYEEGKGIANEDQIKRSVKQ